MKVKIIKEPPENAPFWVLRGNSYSVYNIQHNYGELVYYGILEPHGDGSFHITSDYVKEVTKMDETPNKETTIEVRESQLKAFRKAAIIAREYCQEALVEHEKKIGGSILRKEIILEEGLKKDLTFLEDVVVCFEDIFPEDYE